MKSCMGPGCIRFWFREAGAVQELTEIDRPVVVGGGPPSTVALVMRVQKTRIFGATDDIPTPNPLPVHCFFSRPFDRTSVPTTEDIDGGLLILETAQGPLCPRPARRLKATLDEACIHLSEYPLRRTATYLLLSTRGSPSGSFTTTSVSLPRVIGHE
ncbi:hypothetical protein LY78DRAFT_4310 [Colletotrichum sublineola]|nr:hypothetical protein LY78DRAFT_4310 [Colletotrichum sublineola]